MNLPTPYLQGTAKPTCYYEQSENVAKKCLKCDSLTVVVQSGYHDHEWLCQNCLNAVTLWLAEDGGMERSDLEHERAKYPLLSFKANVVV